jgi:hypothetical protein
MDKKMTEDELGRHAAHMGYLYLFNLFIPMCYYKQYKIIPSNTSLLLSDLRPGYMFRYQVLSSGINHNRKSRIIQFTVTKLPIYIRTI